MENVQRKMKMLRIYEENKSGTREALEASELFCSERRFRDHKILFDGQRLNVKLSSSSFF